MNYDEVFAPWKELAASTPTLKFFVLEGHEPKAVADQAAHEAWFRAHTEWLIADQTIKGTRVTTFFFGIDWPQAGMLDTSDELPPVLWATIVKWPGSYEMKIITGSTVLEDALCAHGVVVSRLKAEAVPAGITQQSWAVNDLVEAVNDESDRRHQRGKYDTTKTVEKPEQPTTIYSGFAKLPDGAPPGSIAIPDKPREEQKINGLDHTA